MSRESPIDERVGAQRTKRARYPRVGEIYSRHVTKKARGNRRPNGVVQVRHVAEEWFEEETHLSRDLGAETQSSRRRNARHFGCVLQNVRLLCPLASG